MANDNKRKLYDALSQDYDMGSYEQFCTDLNDEGKRRKLYDAASQEYDLGTWDSFLSQLGYGRNIASDNESTETTDAQSHVQEEGRDEPEGYGEKPWTPSVAEKLNAMAAAGSVVDDFKKSSDEGVGNVGRMFGKMTVEGRRRQKSGEMKARMSGKTTTLPGFTPQMPADGMDGSSEGEKPDGRKPDDLQGPVAYGVKMNENGSEDVEWLMPDGSLTTDFMAADQAAGNARIARLHHQFAQRMKANGLNPELPEDVVAQQARDRLVKVYAESGEINRQEMEDAYARKEDESFWQYFFRVLGHNPNTQSSAVNRMTSGYDDSLRGTEANRLDAERQTLEKTLESYAARHLKKGDGFWDFQNIRNLGHGIWDVMTDIDTYAGGSREFQRMGQLMAVKNKVDSGEELSDRDLSLVQALLGQQVVDASGETPHGYNVGRITAEMVPFMIQMAMNPASGLGQKLGQKMVKKFGQKAAKQWAVNMTKAIGKKRAAAVMKGVGVTGGDLASSAILANTLQAPATFADARARQLGEVVIDDSGAISFVGGDGALKSFLKAEGAAAIEDYTEMLGAHFGAIGSAISKGAGSVVRKLGGGRMLDSVTEFMTRVKANDWVKAIGNIEQKAQWNGSLGEVLEEEAGIVLNSMFVGDNKISDLVDLDQQIDIVLGVGCFGAFVSGLKTVGYPVARHMAEKEQRVQSNIGSVRFGEDWKDIIDRIDNCDERDMGTTVGSLIREHASSDEQAKTILNYARAVVKARGYNLAKESASADDGISEEERMIENAFGAGYEASGNREMNDAENMYEYQRQRFVTELAGMGNENIDEILSHIENDPIGALRAYMQPETREIMLDYLNAKTVRDGMIQHVNDDIDEQIARSDAMIAERINRQSGMIQPAIMGLDDRQVFVVDGTVAINEDGTVDRGGSDESIIVRDAQTGKLEFTSPKSIVSAGEAIDPEEERATANENIRQQTAQAAVDAMNGSLAFNAGDVVEINTGDGNGNVQVTVAGTAIDKDSGLPVEGQVVVQLPDGQQAVFDKEQLQQMADAANLERLNNYEQERAATRAEQKAAEAEAKRPQFLRGAKRPSRLALNDEFTILNDNGTPIRGSITAELDEDGTVVIHTEEPINGNHVNRFTPAELEEMFDTYNGQPVSMPEPVAEPVAETGNNDAEIIPENGNNDTEIIQVGAEATEPQQSALSRVPVDEQGQPKYDEADPDTAWDAIVEQAQGDEATAAEVVADIVAERQEDFNAAEKALTKTKEGKPEKRKKGDPAPTMAERIAAKNAAKEALAEAQAIRDRAKAALDHWKSIAGTKQRRENERRSAEDAEARRRAAERAAEEARLRAEREEAERIEREALNGVPDWNVDSEDGQDGRPGSSGNADGAEQNPQAAEPADGGTGTASDSGQGGEVGYTTKAPVAFDYYTDGVGVVKSTEFFLMAVAGAFPRAMSAIEAIANKYRSEIIENANPNEFVESKIGSKIHEEIRAAVQEAYNGNTAVDDIVSYMFNNPTGILPSEAHAFQTRIDQLETPAEQHNFDDLDDSALAESIDVADDDWTEGEGQTPTYKRTITIDGKHKVIQIDEPDGNGFYTGSRFEYQGEQFGSLTEVIDLIYKQAQLAANIAAAEAEVNTDPTPGQIEAGNYKKGHVQVGTFDVTIEQPVGSVRRGTDADGKEWETTMQNAYGYIRGTQGVDGDHIDVFLSTDIDAWNGRRVIIVDQYNPGADGSFDEHKVMLGFNDKADAINAYLANYEKGWEKGRRLVFSTATLEDFEKWIESSHRKQKPYHEYKIADKAEVDESTPENPVSATDYTIDTYTTKKNKTYHRVVFPHADKEVWQERLNLAKKMGGTSVPKGYGFKTREEAEAFAKAVADPSAVADAQPLSLDDIRPTSGVAQVDVEGLMSQLSETGEANLADHSTPVEAAPDNKGEEKPEEKPVNPSGNRLVTDERYAELRERMRKKLGGQLNMGVDPEILAIGTEMAVYHIEKGARKFKAYASAMIADLGDAIRPYLKSFYNAVRDMPEAEAAGLVSDMDSYDEVRSVDIANFDKPGTDAMATAAAVVAEQEAETEKAEAERKLQAYRHLVNKYAQDIANHPLFKKAVSLKDSKNIEILSRELYDYYVGNDIESIATNELYKMFVDQWNIDNGVLLSAITAEAIRKAHKAIRDEQTTVNPDGTTSQTVVEAGTEIEITSGDFIPGVRPTVNTEKKPGGKKKPGKAKPKPTTDGGLFDAVEDDAATAPAITVPEQRPEAELMGDSAAYQERETQTVELVEEIGGVIESRVAMLQLAPESVKPLTMTDVKKMASKYPALKEISDTDLQELVELAMTQLTRSEAIVNIDGTAEQQRSAYDHIVNLYQIQPSLNARDSERLIKQQYSTPTPFGYVMGQFVRAGGKTVGSMLEPSAGNGALTITVHPSLVHVNDIDEARLANLRKLGYAQVTAQDALLPFEGDKVDVVMTNPPFGTVTEKVYDGIFHISSLEAQMAINALEKMKDDGRSAIVIGGNTSYRTNGSMNPKDAAFFGYLYSHYNVADVINISGKALYSRNGTGYDVRMILIDGRKTGEFQRVFPPVKAKARAEQVTTFDELYKRVQDDIQQIQQVGSQSADVQREPETTTDGTASAPIRSGSNRPNSGAGQRPGTTSDAVRDTPRTDSGQSATVDDGSSPVGVDNAVSGDAGSSDNVPQPKPQQSRSVGSGSTQNGTRRSGSDGRGATTSRPDSGTERLAVKPDLTTEKVPYPNQSGNGFTLMSVVPAAQAQVLQKSLGEIGDVDQYLVDELGYSSKEELYGYLAAEQIDSVALAIHQMNKGNAFIIGDMTGVGKGRQGAALIRYAVKQGKVPIYFTQKPTLFTDNYRDLADIGSSDLRPFIIASNPKDANIVDADGNIVHKLPSKKEQERVFAYIMEHGTLPDEYDYVLTTYDQIKNGTADYTQNEDGTWNTEARKLPKKSKGYTTADYNGQTRRDALAKLAEGNIAILDESHTVGGDSGCGRYMQMLTSSAGGVTFLSATFAKRADNMPIYAQRTAIAEAEVKASELIDAIMKGGVTLQEIMSKQLVESGQMIRRERSFEGVTIDWLSVEEGTDRRQREQFDEVAAIFNAIRNFQDDYITPIIDAKNEAAAEWGATVGHTQGTKDMGVKNVPFASKMYNLVNQLLFALKVDAVADRVVENLRNGYKPVISFTNTMEGFLSSAPKGVAMDEVPNFSLTLMRALDGVMRFTEKDADENTEGGSISLSELSAEGQKAYNAIRDKIMNLAADLPISPMDAIRMRIEEAGYSVAEITGRTMQLNRTADGKYIVEARKDRDKKAAMRDFNSGKLDVLMINKSGSTGISLHASSKFEDQRQRVMVFAQFQSDINDEVQMRGRIDRSGQVTRGRYEYIMSTIPAEQRIQMMFKAKLKSLDANTTSSQKSKFNEMEIVDYLNKYGDEVVWEYMKEHPELEERLGDPLDMLQEKDSEDGPRTSEKEDTSKKTGCAGKISRYLAFLSVDEQDEIFKEITEAYRVKIQLLDDAGENDLEITTMPLRAETKRKQIWHEGVNPGSGNAFADNTYVEEVEVDVLKKPMKRDEIIEATRKLVGEKGIATEYDQQRYGFKEGEVNWNRYADVMRSEIDQFFQAKADEAVGKMKDAGEARIAKAREKAVTAATKAKGRGENNFTDEEIQSLADTVANEAREKEVAKQRKRHGEIMAQKERITTLLAHLRAGSIYVVPQDLKQGTAEMFSQTFGTFVGFKFNKGYTLGSSTAIFATLDGRRKVELALSDGALSTIISATQIAYRYSPKEINAISMENWDSHVPTQTRQKRYIITGNLLQALVDTEKGDRTRGNLISFSTMDGETRQGILMGENFKLTDLRNSVPLSSRLAQIREGQAVVSENGDVQISKELYDWRHRGEYELRVPKSKQRGGVYSMNPDLLKLVSGNNFTTKGNNMVGYVAEADIAKVVDMLSRAPFNLTVLQESQLSDVSENEAEEDVLCRPVTDKETLDRLNNEPTIKVYRAMQMIDGGLRPPMSGKVDGQWRDATEVGVWEEAEEHPEMADENGRFKLDKGNGKSIKAAYNPYIHTSRSPINDQFSSAWSRPELVTVEVEIPESELTSGYRAEKANAPVGEKDWKSGPVSRALAKIGQARRVILSRWSRIIRVVPVEEVAEAYAQRLNAHGIEVPFNTVPPALREALAERGVKIGKPEKGNAGAASMPAFEQWIAEQERQRMGDGYGAYSDEAVSTAGDPVSKVIGRNRFSKKRQAEFAARERERMVARIEELASKLHIDKGQLEIVMDASQLEGKRATAKGFYNRRTKKITIVIPNNVSTIDAEQTLLHEAVAHYGLRQLFGEQFNTFLDNVYESADESIRRKIAEMAAKNGWDFRTATEEYLAGLAEDTEFESMNATWWSRIKQLFLDMLESIGFEGFRDKTGVVLTDNELRYILWRSYENLAEPGRYRSILGEAADIAKQSELKVGNYAEQGIEAEYAAEPSDIAEINEVNNTFNEQLHQQINHTLPKGHIYQLGRPGKILRSTGIPDLPIQMSATRLKSKATEYGHDFDISEIKNLVKELQDPVAVFAYGNKGKMQNIVVGIASNGKQFIVGLSLNPVVNGKALEINSIRNVFPKDNAEWLNWISQGKMLYADKEKIQALIDKQRTILADVDYLNLDDVTKIVENFENPTIEDEELFRPGDFTPRDKVMARDRYERIVSSGSYQFREAVQDSMLGLKELYKAISDGAKAPKQKQKSFRIEDVAGFENAYLFENRMSSINAGEQHEYFQRYMKPLLKEIGVIAGANERKRKDLTDYLMAKHGLERNEYMRNEAAANGEDTDRDFAGLIGLTGEADWQAAEDTARQWVDDYEAMYDTAALWEAINKATKATLEKVYLSGIISKDTYEKILGMYDYYVPLRGWNEKTSDEVYGYLTSKDGPLGGSIMKKAEGRESMADDPIATIGMMADDAIRQGNRNLMKQRFLNFILNHPSDAVSVHDLWLEYNDVTDEWVPVFADVEETDTAEVVEQKVKDFEERMEALRTAEPDKYKRGRETQHIPYKVVRGNLREHQILIKRNGRTFVATINGNPRAAQALNGLTNPDVDQNGVVGNMLKAGTWINRQLSAFYTTRNPDFVVSNFFRDALYSNCMTWVKESPRYARRFHKNFGRVNPIVMRRLLGKWEKGKLNMSNRIEALFYQFMKNGGETGYTNVRDIEGHKRAVAAELKKQGSTGRRVWTALGMQLDLLNRSAENCARFAAFVTSREFGRNIDRAIYDAKEISVNFNKKGSGGKMVNANGQTVLGKAGSYLGGGGRLLYVFWNAGIQGFTNFGRQAKLHPAKFTAGATALFSLGYVIPMLAQMLGGGDGDDDDKNAYYNLPEYIRRSNICFYAGEQWITIPLPIEYRAMYGMGELAHGVISGNERYTNAELGRQMAAQISQIMPLDMLEGGGGISPFIPSAAKPFTEAYIMNKSWTGLPVYKDTPFNKNDPEWTKAYASADKHLVAFAKWLNEVSGGDDFKKGSIDINPAKIEYLLNGTFGGMFTFPNKIKKTGETMFGDRDFEWRNMPIANRLIKSGDERTANRKLQNEYFKYLKEYEATGQLMRKYENADEDGIMGYAERINFLENSPEYARWEIFDEFKPDIDAYREDIAEETDKEERKKLEAEMYAVMRELVNALHDPEAYRNSEQQ